MKIPFTIMKKKNVSKTFLRVSEVEGGRETHICIKRKYIRHNEIEEGFYFLRHQKKTSAWH